MLVSALLLVLGIGILVLAGDLFVRGAEGLAQKLHIPTFLIGLTIVAFGTSAPELVVGVRAALAGSGDIALGNIVGSNVANILLVLGLPAIIAFVPTETKGGLFNCLLMLLATAGFVLLGLDGSYDFLDGILLFSAIIVYLIAQLIAERFAKTRSETLQHAQEVIEEAGKGGWGLPLLLLGAGLVGLPLGAELIVKNASSLAAAIGVPDAVVALTMLAFGTSLPELATVIAAVARKDAGLAVGNIIGSNLFNLLAVGGASAIAGILILPEQFLWLDFWVMGAAAILLFLLIALRWRLTRMMGLAWLLAYGIYISALFWLNLSTGSVG